jgi:hypothetical protein
MESEKGKRLTLLAEAAVLSSINEEREEELEIFRGWKIYAEAQTRQAPSQKWGVLVTMSGTPWYRNSLCLLHGMLNLEIICCRSVPGGDQKERGRTEKALILCHQSVIIMFLDYNNPSINSSTMSTAGDFTVLSKHAN